MYRYILIFVCVLQFVSEVRVLCTPQEPVLHSPNMLAYIFIFTNIYRYMCVYWMCINKYWYECVLHFVSEVRILCTAQEPILHAPNLLGYIFICINMYWYMCVFCSSWTSVVSVSLRKNTSSTHRIYSPIYSYVYVCILQFVGEVRVL